MGDWPVASGIVERGVKKHLHAATAGAFDPGTEQHVRLPDLIAEFGFELFVRPWCEELSFREAVLLEEAIQGGSGDGRLVVSGGQG